MLTEKNEAKLSELRGRIRPYMREKRLLHTYAVEEEIRVLSGIYCPDKEFYLRASALLHDITKELKLDAQLALCDEFNIKYTEGEKLSPKIFHAKTAPAVVKRDFSEFDLEEITPQIRWHTTGRRDMSLADCLLYLADWIEPTRTFSLCRELRKFFYDGIEAAKNQADKENLLLETMVKALDMTITVLIEDGGIIHPDTLEARNYFIEKRNKGKDLR